MAFELFPNPNTSKNKSNGNNNSTENGVQSEDRDSKTGRFLPGNCANPGGRPIGSLSWSSVLRKAFEQDSGDGRTFMEVATEALCKRAMKGDRSLELAMDRMEGKPRQTVEIEQQVKDELVIINEPDESKEEE